MSTCPDLQSPARCSLNAVSIGELPDKYASSVIVVLSPLEFFRRFCISRTNLGLLTPDDRNDTLSRNVCNYQSTLSAWQKSEDLISLFTDHPMEVHGGVFGWGTALQAGSSPARLPIVTLEVFIDIILPATLWRWG
jgi:hypothetical protein